MEGIKPIETIYNGYRFRSRLEARWAVFFDALGVKWEYEPEGYDLGAGLYYLPDFVLYIENPWERTPMKLFVEVKGVLTNEDARKIKMFYEGGCETFQKRKALEAQQCGMTFTSPEYKAIESELEKLPFYPIAVVGSFPRSDDISDIWDECGEISYYGSDTAYCVEYDVGCYNFSTIDGDYWPWILGVSEDGRVGLFDENGYWHIDEERTVSAYRVARQARFEHGETLTPKEVRQKVLRAIKSENRLASVDENVRAMNGEVTYGEYPKIMSAEDIRQAIENVVAKAREAESNNGVAKQEQTAKASGRYKLDLSPLHRIGQQESEHEAT